MSRIAVALTLMFLSFAASAGQQSPSGRLTLEQIMADPDWIAGQIQVPEEFEQRGGAPYFGVDGATVYYSLKRKGSPIYDLHRIVLGDGKDSVIDAASMKSADGNQTVYSQTNTHAAFIRNGDVFLRDLRNGTTIQITRSEEHESSPQFSADGNKLSFRAHDSWFVYDLASATTMPAAILKTEKDPAAAPKDDAQRAMQLRLFSTLRKIDDDKKSAREHAQQMQRDDTSRAALPFYLGADTRIVDAQLSPDTRWMLVTTQAVGFDEGKKGKLTRYVTDSGYADFESVRIRVGRNGPAPQTLWLFDLAAHTSMKLDYSTLPGIHDDPLKAIRAENAKSGTSKTSDQGSSGKHGSHDKPAKDRKPKDRSLQVVGIVFNRSGSTAAVQLRAIDNKDRWIVSVTPADPALKVQHRLHDDAWINWTFNSFGWENDNKTLWFESEQTGFAQLYVKAPDAKPRALTHGTFEVSQPELSSDGRWFYMRSNAEAPYAYDVYRVAATGGDLERITHYQGMDAFTLSHDGTRLLVVHSTSYLPPQLAVVGSDGQSAPIELTDTRTPEYKGMRWVAPDFVKVASSHFNGGIWAKFYKPADYNKSAQHPAILFVHGAGYLQDVNKSWSYYFREQMFNNLLLQHGYVVLDMDYRASEGYGRDWRTAIYRDMGHPELEDLLDGKQWLVKNWNVDPQRVGIYGGSYGGFMTLMAMFRAPGQFAAGAALRPVSDWAQYNDGYTANILNRPQVDPIAYRRSSPIEFADGLKGDLLICHGVIDNNVLFEDSIRLYERLIELHKDNFWISPYPLDRHGFTNADSWLDEYKRIYHLFDRTIGAGK
ncbi:MAG: prolyl oligopeptidase family serine peptidase [Rudaea sp.]